MGIKQWFGKSLVSLIQEAQQIQDVQVNHIRGMESMFGGVSPAVVAFKISNGYVVRTVDAHADMVGMRHGGFHYCKDHQEIAEHILTVEVQRKLGLRHEDYQQEMFADEKARAVAMQGNFAQSKRAPSRI